MSKKVRRVRRLTTPETTDTPAPEEKALPPAPARPAPRPVSRSATTAGSRRAVPRRDTPIRQTVTIEELKEEYAYVARDLRRVFILAAAMFTLLILLNLALG
ncbi:MAG: hypothetical protein Fur0021_39250 [Candidatus Promineifilaceae bacterium]